MVLEWLLITTSMTALETKTRSGSDAGLSELPQLVPSSRCVQCEVCCRFPDADSPLRPYFTGREISRAIDAGVEGRVFPDRAGSQISLVKDLQGEGFHCPVFDAENRTCRIYEQRPLDCQLYPLALMWNETHNEVQLGWDAKCPFVQEQVADSVRAHAERVKSLLLQANVIREIANHPRLIGSYQSDVVTLSSLPEVTEALLEQWGARPLRRLQWEDLPRFKAALDRSGLCGPQSLAAYSADYHYVWNGLLPHWWMEAAGAFCLFAQSPDGWFMPLPPLTDGTLDDPIREAFSAMHRWNGESAVSRIENVPAFLADTLKAKGYRLTSKEPDYLYRAFDLAALAGDRYKAQRALCNRAERRGITIEPYCTSNRSECRSLFLDWRRQKTSQASDSFAAALLEDASSVHEAVWAHGLELELVGSVLRVDGVVRAYTFGYWLDRRTWCVLLEVADRTIPGLAQFLFRDTCRNALAQGAEFINTMDDSGLAALRSSKKAYGPVAQIDNFICTETARA